MIRLTALNDDSSRSSVEVEIHPKEPPLEVQEENALKLYNEALQEQKSGDIDKAEELFKQLLNTNFLLKVKTEDDNVKLKKSDNVFSLYSKPDLMLKYSCYKNLAVLSERKNLLNEALEFYSQALEVDGSDVTMWYQMGCAALKLFNLKAALEAFFKGLEYSPRHWPSLDKLIMCLFALNDYVNCLYFISKAFDIDVNYTRGQVLRDYIFTEQPSLEFDIKYFFPKIQLHSSKKCEVIEEIQNKLLNEVLQISKGYANKCKEEAFTAEEISSYSPKKKIDTPTWACLGESILEMFEEITNGEKYISLLTPINLSESLNESMIFSEDNKEGLNDHKETNDCGGVKASDDKSSKKSADGNCEKKNKKNKGSALMEELLWSGKRRSARVRSSLRGNPEPVDVAEALRRILPRKLLHKAKQPKTKDFTKTSVLDEDSLDTMDLYRLFERQESAEEKRLKEEQDRNEVEQDIGKIVDSEGYFGKLNEENDVKEFIHNESGNNIIEIVKLYVMALKKYWNKTWPNGLPLVYIKCFQLMRTHYPLDFKMCTTELKFKELVEESGCVLLYGELYLEYSASIRNKSTNEQNSCSKPLQIIFLQNIMELTDRKDMFDTDESYFEFLIRLYWLRCRIFLDKGQTNLAIVALNDVLACYELFPQFQSTTVHLKNCKKYNVISKNFTEEFLVHQSRKRSLAEVVRLYEDESYRELTEILKDTFTTATDTVNNYFREEENKLIDRQTQLSMLINGLYHLNEYKECIFWLETGCYEILQKAPINFLPAEEEGESWMVTFDRFLAAIENCIQLGKIKITDALPRNRLSRFVQTLCHAVCKELEDSDRPPCPARPWIMLNTILIDLEDDEKSDTTNDEIDVDEGNEEEDDNDIPPSILILFTAHEYLGRREWCNCNESVLLFLIMDQVIPHIRSSEWSSFRETIQQHLEQVIYCLYSHPNKKSKARYLTEHNVNTIPLTWQRGIQLFDLFRPDETPSYDSLRINLISSETEVLFRRIAALIPNDKDPSQVSNKMTEFIVGKRNDVPDISISLPEAVRDLFYILGDYYFKTHEFAKAVNYLLMDLCANPGRVDSWASMALSRASLLEQQLNSCDPLKDEVFLQSALSALRCYEHCLQLDNKQCALWIEYGSFVYTIHSFCSQRMKLESFNLSLEQFEELESTKNKMLETAKQAFVNANLIWYEVKEENERQDERWLHHYMLGKICEKNGDLNFFDHYEKAADLLYENEAEFPSKVGYTAPQTLAIEALEVYYRVHVCIIKNLELNEGKPLDQKTRQLFNKHLNICSKGPFAKQVSKVDLAKVKAKELEVIQQEKQLKIIKSVLNDIILKIETENENNESKRKLSFTEDKNKLISKETSICDIETSETKEKLESESQKDKGNNEMEKSSHVCFESKIVEENLTEETDMIVDSEEQKIEESDLNKSIDVLSEHEPAVNETDEINVSSSEELESSQKYDKNPSDNYFERMEEYKNEEQHGFKGKKRRRESQDSVTSSSCGSGEIRNDDESSSSSTSSDSSASSQTSSSSSSESSHSQSDDTNKDASKETDDDDKHSDNDKEKTSAENCTDFTVGENNKKSDASSNLSENSMLMRCLQAFETCALRFPQHYKSVYRLAHFYFRSKEHRDIGKCKELLLGRYQTPNGTIPGLFAERKNTNFFNGIWRIPAGDVDRPGSFASHMSRSVLLLMEVLRDLKDHKMLLEICLQLRKTPEPDKKYLREDERNQLSSQSCDLAIQTLRKNVKDSTVMTLPIVLDCYRCYQKVQKHYSHKESVYGDILLEAFKRLGKGDKCSLEQALRFCQSEVSVVKTKVPKTLNPNVPVTPKPPKPKKQEKKKLTPKPQMTAKVIQKTPKPKKSGDVKKRSSFNLGLPPNLFMDPSFWSSLVKPTMEQKITDSMALNLAGAQMYAEMLRTAALSVKQREQADKKMAEQMSLKSGLDQLKSEGNQKSPTDLMKFLSGFYPYQNYPFDFTSEKYKQLLANYWGNLSLAGNLYGQMQSMNLKTKTKASKSHSVLKSNAYQKAETSKSDELKPKTNFNIEDILNKPSLTITKTPTPAPSSTSSPCIKSIEEKIKSISKEVHITKCSSSSSPSSSQVINLSTGRKSTGETGKRSHSEKFGESGSGTPTTVKKLCRESEQTTNSNNEKIEVVVIDD